jgi:hypothetical protein
VLNNLLHHGAGSAESRSALKQLAGGEVFDEVAVGGEEVVGRQVFELDPLELMEDAVLELATELVHSEELEVDGAAMAIIVADVGDVNADFGGDAEFLVEFAGEGLFGCLTELDFASRKLPLESHGLIGTPLANKDFSTTDD